MIFSSITFLCYFLPIMVIGYFICPFKCRNLFLLAGSLFFYAWGEPVYIFLMLLSIAGNYVFGILLYQNRKEQRREIEAKIVLIVAVLFNLLLLCYFKYCDFGIDMINSIFKTNIALRNIALPIGISFYTFQGMSYVIDVYREEGKAGENAIVQKNPLNLALYISMFPQLIAGPIVRYKDIKNELIKRKSDREDVVAGIRRFIIGLSKKAIIANGIGQAADAIFTGEFSTMGALTAWAGMLFYTLQIYYDFSGYSDMAIGLGRIFGFHFMENFNYPYISKSITEFWRRWHISLSGWFRDYLYIPLGGNRKGNIYLHLFIVFAATGIWHGASLGFLLWGLWHGLFIILERIWLKNQEKLPKWKLPSFFSWLYCMLVVNFGFIVFRLISIRQTIDYLKVMFGIRDREYVAFGLGYYCNSYTILILVIALIAAVPHRFRLPEGLEKIGLVLLLAISMLSIVNGNYNPFIYFRF